MSYLVICTTALIVSGLTLFSGFGLGTILMPAFALFFPIKVAVAATAIVHLANNLFKVFLVGQHAHRGLVIKFGIPAAVSAIFGAMLLNYFSGIPPVFEYQIGTRVCTVTWVKLVIATLIILFSIIELSSRFDTLSFDRRYIPFGGMVSGFFGGLSGHQGALRTAFLMRAGMDKDAFIGTMVMSAILVDISRIMVYGLTFFSTDFHILKEQGDFGLVAAGCIAAFTGVFIGKRLLKKITMATIKKTVGGLLILLAMAMGSGLI